MSSLADSLLQLVRRPAPVVNVVLVEVLVLVVKVVVVFLVPLSLLSPLLLCLCAMPSDHLDLPHRQYVDTQGMHRRLGF